MHKHNPQFRAFERRLWGSYETPSYRLDELYWVQPWEYLTELNQAWDQHDWTKLTYMGEAFARNAHVDAKMGARLAFGMIQTGRYQPALTLLLQHQEALSADPQYWRDLARSYAGVGRLDLARAAMHQCLTLAPDFESARKLGADIAEAQDLAARLPERQDWKSFSRLSDLYYGLGALDQAAQVVRGYLGRRLRPEPEEHEPLLRGVQMALAILPGEQVFGVLRDLQYIYGKGGERHTLRNALEVIMGRADQRDAMDGDQPCKRNRDLRLCMALGFLAAGRRGLAVARLGRIADRFKRDWESRLILARTIGEEVLADLKLRYRQDSRRLVVDLFPFNNERELLKIKLAEESPWVDYFVLVESNQTFTGMEKPFYFDQWKDEFASYADKIIHVKVDSMPEWVDTPWAREFYQRDMALTGVADLLGVDDLLLSTDADEVVDGRCLERFAGEYAAMLMHTFRFYLNYHSAKGTQYTGVMFRAKYLQKFSLSCARAFLRSSKYTQVLDDCGWHFTSVGDAAGIANKIRSFAHQEYAHLDEEHFERILEKLRKGRGQEDWEFWPVDERLPAWMRENQSELAHMILQPKQAEALEQA
jgi:hypothetical protein